MVVTEQWIKDNYNYFNKLLFNNTLPKNISFLTNKTKQFWGLAGYRISTIDNTVTPTKITISNYYDSPENIKLGVLIHEMIHIEDYAFCPHHFVRNGRVISKHSYDAHGNVFFLPEANRVNKILAENGFDIKVYKNVQTEEVQASQYSDDIKKRIEAKVKEGTYVFVLHLRKQEENYNYTYVTVHKNNYKKWIKNISESENYYGKYFNYVNIYYTNNEYFSTKRSSKLNDLGFYLSIPLDEFIEKYDLNLKTRMFLNWKSTQETQTQPQETEITQPSNQEVKPQTNTPSTKPTNITLYDNQIIKEISFNIGGSPYRFKNIKVKDLRAKLKQILPQWSNEKIDIFIKKFVNLKENINMKTKKEKDTIVEEIKQIVMEKLNNTEDSSQEVGCRRTKMKEIEPGVFEQSIE